MLSFSLIGALAYAISAAQSPPTQPSFEVASIKPTKSASPRVVLGTLPGGRFTAKNVTLKMLIRTAYSVQEFQISDIPRELDSARYDIDAEPGEESRKSVDALQHAQTKLMIQALLADRFKLRLHTETRELPMYGLVVAKNGPRLSETSATTTTEAPKQAQFKGIRIGSGELDGHDAQTAQLANVLSIQLARTVVDKTGLAKTYDFTLRWTPFENQVQTPTGASDTEAGEKASGPSIFTALQEQLGLKLEPEKGPVNILIVDHAEQPSPN